MQTALGLAAAVVCAVTPAVLAGQDARYIGRASGSVSADGPDPATDAQAGGDTPGKTCDIETTECFDVTAGTSNTHGGAQFPDGTPNPGFPRCESRAGGALISLGPIEVLTGATVAFADSFTGELGGEVGSALVRVAGIEIPLAEGQDIDLVIVRILVGRRTIEARDGLSVITVEGTIVEIPSGGDEMVFGRAICGLEMPFTTGGGGGGCSVAPAGRGADVAGTAAVLGLLAWIARRRRRA